MKYLVVATAAELEAKVDKRFGHPAFYLVVDSESYEFKAFPGPAEHEPSLDLNRFNEFNLDGAISGNFGPGNFRALQARGLKAYVCRGMTVREAVDSVASGKVKPAEESTMKVSVRGKKEVPPGMSKGIFKGGHTGPGGGKMGRIPGAGRKRGGR